MEYGIWSLHAAGELWGGPQLPRRHPIVPGSASQILPRAALALSGLHRPADVPVRLALSPAPGPPLEPIELVTKPVVAFARSDDEAEPEPPPGTEPEAPIGHRVPRGRLARPSCDDGDNVEKSDENRNETAMTIEDESNENGNGNGAGNDSDSGSTNGSRQSVNNNFPTKLLNPMACLGLDKEGAVTPVLNGWVLGAYTAMLGRLSAATAALEATEIPDVPSNSDSESEHSSYTERSRGSSPSARSHHRAYSSGYSCGSCDARVSTRQALRKHALGCRPAVSVAAATATSTSSGPAGSQEARRCPSAGCEFASNSRCELESHVEAHVAQGVVPTGKKRTLALQRVRYRYEREEYRCSLCSYACTIEKAFQRHLRAHARGTAPETRVSCAVCGADRSSEVDLSRHMRRHRDDRYFCCDICIFRTVQLKKLIQHRRMHTGEKPHLCPHCTYRSARRDNLRSHVRRVHKKENLYCDTFSPRGMLIAPMIHASDASPVRSPARSPSPSASPTSSPSSSPSPPPPNLEKQTN